MASSVSYEESRLIALAIPGRQVLLLFLKGASSGQNSVPGGLIPPHDGQGRLHLAFAIEAAEQKAWRRHLTANNITIESEVIGDRGGRSLYFRDPDNHLVELAPPDCGKSTEEDTRYKIEDISKCLTQRRSASSNI